MSLRENIDRPDVLEADPHKSSDGAWRERRRGAVIALLIAGFFLVFCRRVIFLGEVLIGGDAQYYSYPLRTLAWGTIKSGSLPLWLPHLFGGYPLLSMSQLGLGYPLTWGYLFLPRHWAEQTYLLAPFLLGSSFTYLYVREIGRSRLASLLAGLSFAYGGFFTPGVAGYLTNGVIWLPLMLVAVERARKVRRLGPCLLLATGAYAMSILNGLGQSFLYVAVLAVAYALFVGLFDSRRNTTEVGRKSVWRARLTPLALVVVAILLAVGLTAVQTLETWQAIRLSIREAISYQTFTEGSFTAYAAWKSFIAPRFNIVDVMTYVSSLGAVLAVCAVVFASIRIRTDRNSRVFFWAAAAVAAWLLMLGGNTPLYRLVYWLPLVNLFRVPARHAFEWTFALSILSAYGWDAVAKILAAGETESAVVGRKKIMVSAAFLLVTVGVGAYWLSLSTHSSSESSYVFVKLVFTFAATTTIWQGFRLVSASARAFVLGAAVLVACFVEPSIVFGHVWYPNRQVETPAGFMPPAPPTRFLRQFPAADGRVYTDGPSILGLFDSFDVAAMHGLHNVAGYEPAMLARYSRALGHAGPDTLQVRPGFTSDCNLFEPRSHVLDLLNTRYVTSFWDLGDSLDGDVEKDGIKFAAAAAPVKMRPRESASFSQPMSEGDTLAVVSTLAYANGVRQGEPVATVRIYLAEGGVIERVMRAGVDTAEWAHERADIRPTIPHALAPVFDSAPGDEHNSFPAYRYVSHLPLGSRQRVSRLEIVNTSGVPLALWKLTLYDSLSESKSRRSVPFMLMGFDRWEPVYNKDHVLILRNKRALPRAWLVGEAEAVSEEEALRAIQGKRERPFDPEHTALLEVPSAELPDLPEKQLRNASARIVVYEPNRLIIEAGADYPSLLVVSETNYPGWMAEVDGVKTRIYQANYLFRGILLPAGKHRVEMHYTAPAARRGLVLAFLSAALLLGVTLLMLRSPAPDGGKSG